MSAVTRRTADYATEVSGKPFAVMSVPGGTLVSKERRRRAAEEQREEVTAHFRAAGLDERIHWAPDDPGFSSATPVEYWGEPVTLDARRTVERSIGRRVMADKTALDYLVGETIEGILVSQANKGHPYNQVFLILSGGWVYELYGDDLQCAKNIHTGGWEFAEEYAAKFGGKIMRYRRG